ncbi:hypothetical protein RDI58_021099 [Solanum bulbocastanum]|uniref:Neprosin PEP catalytic domain-containing protein n=1 Tax=Solanum bulbocastanum TaxID=147425 RepID=A0AAN8TDP3_SOLBU
MIEVRMHQKIVQQILLVLCLFLSYNGVQGRKKLSELEDIELEKRLKLLNKPAVKTVKTKSGESYDCMKPTFAEIKQNSYGSTTNRLPTIWSKDGGCPSGTVPIKRITKDDLIRQRNMPPPEPANFDDEFVVSNNNIEQKGSYYPFYGYKRAIAIPQYDPNFTKFSGAGMATNLFNPHVEGQQHSACRIKIQNGSDILQVGWRVDPTLYGDNNTRLYLHYQTGEKHCFNTLCPGFVHVRTDIPLDMSFEDNLSHRGVITTEVDLYIYRDTGTGNWWLLLGPEYTQVGFWPHNILNELKGFATNVDWGGVIYNPPGLPEPPMGSSFFPFGNNRLDAYCRNIAVSNEDGDSVGVYSIVALTENKFAYGIQFKELTEGSNTFTYVFYGGPGISNP